MTEPLGAEDLQPCDDFVRRHLGDNAQDVSDMLQALQVDSVEALLAQTVPDDIRLTQPLHLQGLPVQGGLGEAALHKRMQALAGNNATRRCCLGMGYYDTHTPAPIARNILEDPGWYTQYTPYQAEIAQGRLEALLNFQTMVSELTGLPVANASLLDEGTAAAEAMALAYANARGQKNTFFISDRVHPQTISVMLTRAAALGIHAVVGPQSEAPVEAGALCGMLVQYPDTFGRIYDFAALGEALHANGAQFVVATDLLALCLLRPPGDFGADIAVGSAQRFGIPMGYGGPHAAFFATRDSFKRLLPGRVIGVSKDAQGNRALRMAMQTREQHIRREKATSNICTAQALLAIMAGMYAVYHGPTGLRRIALRVHKLTCLLATGLRSLGFEVDAAPFFDTLRIHSATVSAQAMLEAARAAGFDIRGLEAHAVGVSLDETTETVDVEALWGAFARAHTRAQPALASILAQTSVVQLGDLARTTPPLQHPIFSRYHSEHELLRYMTKLRNRDFSLAHGMIPLGSCTMKLNATSEMSPISLPGFARLHPFVPVDAAPGYTKLFDDLGAWLCNVTGFAAVSLQPNAGAQGEYAGLMVIRAYHQARGQKARGQKARDICLIPVSAHGTNPASAAMAGMRVVVVACDSRGNIEVEDLRAKAKAHKDTLAALMVTYPSTHGVFESQIRDICAIVHDHGAQVYLDGANMNAQVGLCRPGDYGADVCHLNLHKTFCIPHGGGGPGMGPIGVAAHLKDYLPRHPVVETGGKDGIGPVSAAPWGSASILPISYAYIAMMGAQGLRDASAQAILHANYMAERLQDAYTVLYRGARGRVAHEFILDIRPFKQTCGVEAEDIAKRLMDYGFHAPTMSFPVAGTLMIEPTESESKIEIDRFCEAMLSIRAEIAAIEQGQISRDDNVLKNAPHTAAMVMADAWQRPYSRMQAAFPSDATRQQKFWPSVARIDNAYGDRNLVCTCPPLSSYL